MHYSRMRTTHGSSRLLGGGVCLNACWDTPWVWAWRHPMGVGLETPQDVGLETPQVWAWRHPLRCGPGDTPWVWAWRPPRCGPRDSPRCAPGDPTPRPDPSTSPLCVGLETCKACWDTPLEETCKACWDTPLEETCKACWDTTCTACLDTSPPPPPTATPWTEWLRDTCKNITFANFVCGR